MSSPQSWNRFSYVSNNPVRFNDPTGHMQESDGYTKSDGKCSKGDTSCNWVGKPPKKPGPKPIICSSSMCNPNGGGISGPSIGPDPTSTSTPSSTPGPVIGPITSTPTPGLYIGPGASSTPTFVPPPFIDPIKTAVAEGSGVLNPFSPSFEPFDANQFWNTIGNGLPVLIGLPATSVEQVVTKIINAAIRVAETGTTVIANIGMVVDEAVNIGIGGLSAPPIFYIPSNNPFLPSNGST